ncbi:MAG: UDP-N-acetylmuramoyl-L-alanine--D-glutamate ligase [Prevotella sp.]|nr:UDP-N-acetylmuramoyl-L-alanine--D-glutamate ligase [Prevotella sp.]
MKAKIIGYGVSGKAAESYLEARGIETVVVADADEKVAGDYDFCVVSPGVPAAQLHQETVPIVPEVELPFYCDHRLRPRCLVAVTGTNGKTTVVKQIYRMCTLAEEDAVLCGNVGVPVSRVAARLHGTIAVVEVSSFMLEQTRLLHPQIAVLTNITADHLDRHQNMDEYIRCKSQIVAKQTRHDCLVVNWDDVNTQAVGRVVERLHKTRVIWYSTREVVSGYYVQDGQVWEKRGRRARALGAVSALGGMPHTLSNALAVIAVGRRLRLPLSAIWQACQYQAQPHRMELVADYQGVVFYNDSKATNMAATLAAVQALKMPTCLILCGLSKGQDYHELLTQMPTHVVQVIVFGAIREQVMTLAQGLGLKHVSGVTNLTTAVKRAAQIVPRPGVVLFSPSGSSFDQFTNYEHRGDVFRQTVQELTGQVPQYSPPTDVNL